jgi:ATP-binding cassette subfamily B protein
MVVPEQVKPVRLPDGSELEEEQPRVLPDDVKRALDKLLDPGEEIKAFTQCDLLPSGQFGEAWLFATERRLGLYHHDSTASGLLRDIPLENVRKLGRRDGHGGTLVEVQTTDASVLIGRMTPAHLDDLIQVLPEMQKLLPDPGPVEEHFHWRRQKKRSSAVCPKCGNPIPHWAGTCVNCLQKRQLIFRLFHRVTSYWQIIAAGLLMMLVIKGADLVQPWLQARLIDGAIKHGSLHLLFEIILALVVVSIVSLGIGGLQSYMMSWFGQKVIYDLRSEMYQHIQRLSVAFYDSKQTGWIMDRITSDTTNLQDFLSDALLDFINNTLTIVLIVIIMFAWNWKLAILTILPTPFIAWAASVFMHKGHRLWHRAWRKRSRMSTLLTDVLPGVRVVKAFGAEGREVDRFDNRSQDFMNASVGAARFFAYFGPITGLLTTIGFMTVWAYGGYQAIVTPRLMTVGTLVAFIQYLWRFYQPIQSLSGMAQRFERSATAAQRVFEVLDTPPDVEDSDDARAMPPIVGVVEFDNVTFGYEPHNDVLKGVSFTVQPGEMVGLVGPSGAGKSTAINLLCRFYDVLGGAIRIDGIDVRDVTLGSLRDHWGWCYRSRSCSPAHCSITLPMAGPAPAAGMSSRRPRRPIATISSSSSRMVTIRWWESAEPGFPEVSGRGFLLHGLSSRIPAS